MATIRKRTIGKKQYYYLEHSFKADGRVKKMEKYLGKEIPEEIERIKADFIHNLYKDKWFKKLDLIKAKFIKEIRQMPNSANQKYFENFMIKFTYNTNRIEGSKITLKETARLLEEGIAPNKPLRDITETESHKALFYEVIGYKKDLTLSVVLHWHKILFMKSDPEIAGVVRKHNVSVSGSNTEFPFPAELDILLRDFFKWYNRNKNRLHPVELAALVHLNFVSIHPFSDGNGRISRILMNFVLNKNGFPMLNIKYSNRNTYYTALERSQLKQVDQVFVQHIIKRFIKEYSQYCKSGGIN